MSNEETLKILDRVKKLMALGTSPNEAEAASAIAKAHAILAEYNLSIDQIDFQESEIVEETFEEGSAIRDYRKIILNLVAKVNFCQVYSHVFRTRAGYYDRAKTNTKVQIVGKPHNVLGTRLMAEYLIDALERLAKKNAYGKGKSWVHSYKIGVMNSLAAKLNAMVKEDNESSNGLRDLVVSENAAIDAYLRDLNLKSQAKTSKLSDPLAYALGRKDGEGINLNAQIRGEHRSGTLQIGG